jgi:cobalt-zinc-cadmium efflux system membrane fusion protein
MMRYTILPLLVAALLAGACDRIAPSAPAADTHDHAEHDHAAHEGDDHSGHGHDDHAGHDDHSDHAGHDDDDNEAIELSDDALAEFGLELAVAEPGELPISLRLVGEVVFNPDRVAHVSPRVGGVAREVRRSIGDEVERGEVLAILDSRELARMKSEYLAALKRLDIAEANFNREQALWEQKITSESEYLAARQVIEEARIARQLAEEQLHATGLTEDDIDALPEQTHVAMTGYQMQAPISGTIVERHLTQGEVISEHPGDPPFVVADLSSVWVHLTVYPKDLDVVRTGQPTSITTNHGLLHAQGTINYVSPSVGESTRTATARVVLDNASRRWRPGMFVNADVTLETLNETVVVPVDAVQTIDDQPHLFVRTDHGFEPRPVTLGRRGNGRVQITSGITAGETYVAQNAFALKAEMNRAALEHAGHNH